MTAAGASAQRLRVGLFTTAFQVAAWQWALLEKIRASGYAQLSLIVLVEAEDTEARSSTQSLHDAARKPLRALLERANALLESRIMLDADALARCDARELLRDTPEMRISAVTEGSGYRLVNAPWPALNEHRIDVFITFVTLSLTPELASAARYGVWWLQHGDEASGFGDPPGFWEVYTGQPVAAAMLHVATADGGCKVIDRTISATDTVSVLRNNDKLFWAAVSLIPRRLRSLQEEGRGALSHPLAECVPSKPVSAALSRPPTEIELLCHIAKIGYRGLRNKLHDAVYLPQWILLFHFGDAPCTDLERFQKLVPPKDRYWADPVAVQREGKYYVFIEEVPFATNKGHISVIAMDERGKPEAAVPVLKRDYHLSYPFVFEHAGETYMVPESADNRTVELYRCVGFPWKWELAGHLLKDVCAVDATLVRHAGRWWLFANMVENPGGSTWDELFLFYADELLDGKWTPHPRNPIVSDVTRARPAGPVFTRDGKLYRPAQDCSVRYGYGIRLQEIVTLNERDYAEKEVETIMPTWAREIIATHTLSHAGNLTVADALQPRLKL